MLRKLMSHMLVALIVMQSVLAIADVHQEHQAGTEHLVFEADHQHEHAVYLLMDETQLEDQTDSLGSDDPDCHHCCHCHGMSCPFLGANKSELELPRSPQQLSKNNLPYLSNLLLPALRPPIV